MANLLVEIGNTALKAAWSEGDTLGKTFRYQGENRMDFILSLLENEKPGILCIASSANISEDEERIFAGNCGSLVIIDGNHPEAADRYSIPRFLSPDRMASLIAVKSLFKGRACTVFDFGTTLTVDFTGEDGSYRGGNVSLGCMTRLKAVNRYSRTLPLVGIPSETVPAGLSVEQSIGSGAISGIVFEIEGYRRLEPDNVLVFTGGDAAYFAKRMKTSSVFVVSNLTLMGLARITDDYVKENNI